MKKITIIMLVFTMIFSTLGPTYAEVHKVDSLQSITLENGVTLTTDEFINIINDSSKYIIIENEINTHNDIMGHSESYDMLRSSANISTLEGEWTILIFGIGVLTVQIYNNTMKIGDKIISAGDALWDKIVTAVENQIYQSLVDSIPSRFREGNVVDLDKFDKRVGSGVYEEKKGWTVEKDRAGENSHGGSAWKLKDKRGKRKATLDKNGKILRK